MRPTFFRADMGVRSTWDRKVKEGRLLEFFTPLSFSTDPEVSKDFFTATGDRTFTVIKMGIGYNIQQFSAYPYENEIIAEGVTRVRIDKCEKFDKDHPFGARGAGAGGPASNRGFAR